MVYLTSSSFHIILSSSMQEGYAYSFMLTRICSRRICIDKASLLFSRLRELTPVFQEQWVECFPQMNCAYRKTHRSLSLPILSDGVRCIPCCWHGVVLYILLPSLIADLKL